MASDITRVDDASGTLVRLDNPQEALKFENELEKVMGVNIPDVGYECEDSGYSDFIPKPIWNGNHGLVTRIDYTHGDRIEIYSTGRGITIENDGRYSIHVTEPSNNTSNFLSANKCQTKTLATGTFSPDVMARVKAMILAKK